MTDIVPVPEIYRVLGIDLGTTNSTIAEVVYDTANPEPPTARCLEVEQYTTMGNCVSNLIPSFVALYQGREIVGEGAKQLRAFISDRGYGLEQYKTIFYECKNDIGISRTYHKAPEGYRSAAEIGGKVLKFLHDAALRDNPASLDRVVVTVPASFQAAQRLDTLRAAELAGIRITGGDLLDEPVAAFLDYIASNKNAFSIEPDKNKNLLVFDFGGGTCDVAVFGISLPRNSASLKVSPKAVSRYHRLGGGDIDSAIFYEVLLPQLLEQNGLGEFDLDFEEKKRNIEPSFIGIAEGLKIGLCREITRLRKFGAYDNADKEKIVRTFPGVNSCKPSDGRELRLRNPAITAEQFEEILMPFLDIDLLYARETEYRMTCSIFAPIQDALNRSDLESDDIDYCLLVGGSCLIPQVVESVKEYFAKSKVLLYEDYEALQTAVARGASYHALSLATTEKGLIQPVCYDTISIRTSEGLFDLIPKGAELPYPADGSYCVVERLVVPKTTISEPVDLRVEIVAREDNRVLLIGIWRIAGAVNRGDRLNLEYRYDENQILDLKLRLAADNDARPFEIKRENPLTNVVNPQAKKLRIDEIEEDLRVGKIPKSEQADKIVELSENYADLRQYDKAISRLAGVLRVKGPDAEILNKMGIYCGERGDYERQEKYYREAAEVSSWEGPLFNLALAQKRRRKYVEAIKSIEKAIAIDSQPPYLVLRAQLAESTGNKKERDEYLDQAMKEFEPIEAHDDWSLGWYLTAANMLNDPDKIEKAKTEQQRRQRRGEHVEPGGMLPGIVNTPARRS